MTKFVTLALLLATGFPALARIDNQGVAQVLYGNNREDRDFTAKFFELVEAHKKANPLMKGPGPSVKEFSLDKIKFAFMVNETVDTVDLVFFNWSLPVFKGLKLQRRISKLYGSKVYVLRGISKKSVASQGDNNDLLTNFSYIFGSRYMEMSVRKDSPNMEVPKQFLDWKPHPAFMSAEHPLRRTLDTHALVLLSPSKELFFKQAGITEANRSIFESMIEGQGGYYNMIMGMMVHEMFHVKEGEDRVNGLSKKRPVDEDRKTLVEQLKSDAYLKKLMATYMKIVFSIGDHLKLPGVSQAELKALQELKLIISEFKSKYENAWKFIWNYEYTEGFAEYVSAYSMIQVGITPLARQIDLQKTDTNNFAYRTGTLGGLYLVSRLDQMPFSNNEDHRESVWEIVLRQSQIAGEPLAVESVISKYEKVSLDGDEEVSRVIEYLISTVREM